MSMVLEYRNTKEDAFAHHKLLHKNDYQSARSAYYQSAVFWATMLLLASFMAFQADQVLLMCFLLALCGSSSMRSVPS